MTLYFYFPLKVLNFFFYFVLSQKKIYKIDKKKKKSLKRKEFAKMKK